jgi:hypothetical protein
MINYLLILHIKLVIIMNLIFIIMYSNYKILNITDLLFILFSTLNIIILFINIFIIHYLL